jgi:hypothetical protein
VHLAPEVHDFTPTWLGRTTRAATLMRLGGLMRRNGFEPILDGALVGSRLDSSGRERIVFLLLILIEQGTDPQDRVVLQRPKLVDPGISRKRRILPNAKGLLVSFFEDLSHSRLLCLVQIQIPGQTPDMVVNGDPLVGTPCMSRSAGRVGRLSHRRPT